MSDEVSQEYSVCDCDQYLDHLAFISVRRNLVVATEDITNQFGVMLIKSGTPLGSFAVDKLREHRLCKPVDSVLQVQRRLTVAELISRYNEMLNGEADLAAVAAHFRSDDRLRHLCHTMDLSPLLMQRLTVLEQALPRVFHRALFTSWLASLIAYQQERPTEEVELAMLAGLCHDLGLLHIPPELVDKKREIQADEWRAIQRHVVHGALVAESMEIYPDRLARIVLQHHERRDGAGYPTGLSGESLDPLSQVIAVADMIHALRFQRLLLSSHTNLLDCMAFLKVNNTTFGEDHYHTVVSILQHARTGSTALHEGADLPSVEEMLQVNASIEVILEQLTRANELLDGLPESRVKESILSLAQQVQWVSLSSGIGSEVLEYLIRRDDDSAEHIQELRDTVITTQEVVWLIRRIDRQLTELAADAESGFMDSELPGIAAVISGNLDKAWGIFSDRESG